VRIERRRWWQAKYWISGVRDRDPLKKLGVPSRDARIILGHSRLAVTLESYTHEDRQAQREALGKISDVLRRDGQKGQ
jgi:hypothetical protein